MQRNSVCARAVPDGVTSKQASILRHLQGDKDASDSSSRRGLLAGTAAGVVGGCMCGICGASPVQAAAPGDWGYSAQCCPLTVLPCALCHNLCMLLHLSLEHSSLLFTSHKHAVMQLQSRLSFNRLDPTHGVQHVLSERTSHQSTFRTRSSHAPPRTSVTCPRSESPLAIV